MADTIPPFLLRQRIEECIIASERAGSNDAAQMWLQLAAGYLRLWETEEAPGPAGGVGGNVVRMLPN